MRILNGKKKMKRAHIILMHLMLVTQCAMAQSAADDLKKISEAFGTTHTSIDVTYDVYAQHEGNNKVQSVAAKYYVWEKLLAYNMSDVDVFNNDRFILSIDHDSKNMVLNKVNPDFEKKMKNELMKMNLDSVLLKQAQITLVNQTETERTWRVKYSRAMSGVELMDITISVSTFHLQKIVLYYEATFDDIFNQAPDNAKKSDKPRLEITYQKYTDLNEQDKARYFYASNILTVTKKGTVILTDKYKKYNVTNYYNVK
jgi:hypothetical protein